MIKTKIEGNFGVILEVNCQTDFVAKDGGFQAFANKVLDAAVAGKITDVDVLKAQFEEERVALVAKIGENINIRRVSSLEGEVLGSYQHGTVFGAVDFLAGEHRFDGACQSDVCVGLMFFMSNTLLI